MWDICSVIIRIPLGRVVTSTSRTVDRVDQPLGSLSELPLFCPYQQRSLPEERAGVELLSALYLGYVREPHSADWICFVAARNFNFLFADDPDRKRQNSGSTNFTNGSSEEAAEVDGQ